MRFRKVIRKLALRPWLEKKSLRRLAAGQPTLVVFEADWFGLYPFVRPLVLRFAARPSTAVVVVTRDSETSSIRKWIHREALRRRSKVAVVSYESLTSVGLQPALIISCQPYSSIAKSWQNIPKIQLLHGMADKRGDLFGPRKLTDFTHLFSPAPVVTELARDRLLCESRSDQTRLQLVEVGCPKTDDLFDETFERNEVLRNLSLPVDRPTVLYAPTWEKEASLEQHGDRIASTLSDLDVNLLIKPHPLSLVDRTNSFLVENGHGGKDWKHILKKWERQFPNLRWVRDPYANPYMVAADLLVSEGSGIAFEYCLLNKPIVFVDTLLMQGPDEVDTLHRGLRSFGSVVSQIEELPSIVKGELEYATVSDDSNRQMIDRLSYNRGRATITAMEFISRLLEIEDAP